MTEDTLNRGLESLQFMVQRGEISMSEMLLRRYRLKSDYNNQIRKPKNKGTTLTLGMTTNEQIDVYAAKREKNIQKLQIFGTAGAMDDGEAYRKLWIDSMDDGTRQIPPSRDFLANQDYSPIAVKSRRSGMGLAQSFEMQYPSLIPWFFETSEKRKKLLAALSM